MAERNNIEYASVSDVDDPRGTKYTVSGPPPPEGGVRIPRLACCLLTAGALLLAALAALAVYFLAPRACAAEAPPAALTKAALVPAAAQAIAGDVPLQRLPPSVAPTHYALKLMPFLIEGNFTTRGNVSIDVACVAATDRIQLHAVDVDIDRASIRLKYVAGDYFFRLRALTYSGADEMYTFHLDRPMRTGERYWLHMEFVSRLNGLDQGFYRSSYADRDTHTARWIASSHFSPLDARRAFPCFDEPDFAATFSVSLARPNYMTTLSNMPRISTEDSIEMAGYSWDNYERTPNMSTCQLALVVSDLQPYEFGGDGREHRIWARRDAIAHAIYASQIAPKLLKHYEQYFDVAYPLPKLDQVAAPALGADAAPHWGLVVYREAALLVDAQRADPTQQAAVAAAVARALARQWHGNLVAAPWWTHLWLGEGFADYFAHRAVGHALPAWNRSEALLLEAQAAAMRADVYSCARPLAAPMRTSNDVRQLASGGFARAKGAAVIRMLHAVYGEAGFRDAVRHYLSERQYRGAAYADFARAFTERSARVPGLRDAGGELRPLLDGWVTQAGFPVVSVLADYANGTLTLRQRRFRFAPTAGDEEQWWIPVSYATKAQPDFGDTTPRLWMAPGRETRAALDIRDGYLLNLQRAGHYIVNYDERNWKRIARDLRNFPLLVRAQLLGDAMDLARANLLDYDVPLRMLATVARWDNHPLTYGVAFEKLEYVHNMLLSSEAFGRFGAFLAAIFGPAFEHTLPVESAADTYETRQLRALILRWACRSPESRCVGHARQLYRALMISNTLIPASFRETVYCTAIREGGETEFAHALRMYRNATAAADRETLLKALGCTERPWLLARYLNIMLDDAAGVRAQDGALVLAAVARNMRGHALAFAFLRANWPALVERYGIAFDRLGSMVAPLSMYMNTPYDLEQLAAFGDSVQLATARDAFQRVYEDVQLNVEWMRRCHKSVHQWLVMHAEYFAY